MTSLIKNAIRNSIAKAILDQITSRFSQYYYYFGRTNAWIDDLNPPFPADSYNSELQTRNNIISLKAIAPSDVSMVIPRFDWVHGMVVDSYDDQYSTQVIGIDLISGGSSYISPPNITIGDGTGAKATAIISNGKVVSVNMTHGGSGYTSPPSVTFSGGLPTTPAVAVTKIGKSTNGAFRLEDANFYVLTEEHNVYVCVKNNNGAQSTIVPSGVSSSAFQTSDGYVWKYMYTLPLSIRNKFLTYEYMPVLSALNSQFYSNGSIDNVSVQSVGSGYTYGAISVIGDGFKSNEYFYNTGINIISGGSGYTAAQVKFDPPVNVDLPWTASALIDQGAYISNSTGVIYLVENTGSLGLAEPVHTLGSAVNGSVTLSYAGKTMIGTAVVSGGLLTGITLVGNLSDISIVNGGSGYTSPPSVTFSGSGGGTATAVIKNGSIIDIIVNQSGSYSTAPVITIGSTWQSTTVVTAGSQIFYSSRLYTVTISGTTSSTAPSHTSGSVVNGTATLTYAGVVSTATSSLKYGDKYKSPPKATVTGTGTGAIVNVESVKTDAKLLPIFQSGQLTGVHISDAGEGYTSASLIVSGDGTGATIRGEMSVGDINTLQANAEILVTDGSIDSIEVVSGGYDYNAVTISIEGDGTGATATANIVSGRLTSIQIISSGIKYRWAKINITGDGFGASARAIISPFGGQGKNSVNNLLSRSLMIFGDPSRDKVGGFQLENDFREFGIIKSPTVYNNTKFLRDQNATACWAVSGDINTTQFPADAELTNQSNRRYRVVASTSTNALLQSLDNIPIQVGDALKNSELNTFVVTAVTPPNVDKYSGELLFVDDRAPFTPSSEETITLRTVLKF